MLKLPRILAKQLQVVHGKGILSSQQQMQCRDISALYITGDKAKENYVTLQPYLDFEGILRNTEMLEFSIAHRKVDIDLKDILVKYEKYKEVQNKIKQLEAEREKVVKSMKEISKIATSKTIEQDNNALKERGKGLRNDLKSLKENSYPIEDEFIHEFLNLPNILHQNCPSNGNEKILYRSSTTSMGTSVVSHLKHKDLIRFIDNSSYYMMKSAAKFDVHSTHALTNYLVETGGFTQMANPDFVRCVLLEANATPLDHYHMVMEEHLQNKINSAYLTGCAAFESFLGAFTKLCVYPTVLPLRLVSNGRSYQKVRPKENAKIANLYTATQTNAVQTFVATTNASEADEQLENILNLTVNFYKKLNIPFRIRYEDASKLTIAESLRAVVEVYSPVEERYICTGYISNYNDFVSKRILFSMRQQKDHKFLHLIGGPVMYTTRLIAALIENDLKLEECKLLGAYPANEQQCETQSAIDEFKSIFK